MSNPSFSQSRITPQRWQTFVTAEQSKLPKLIKYVPNQILKGLFEPMDNPVLDAIRKRRTVLRFESTEVAKDKIEAILEAGRWAPSWLNKQPWNFIVIKNLKTKEQLSGVVPTTFVQGLREAPVCIAVTVDTEEDPYHFVEAGAIASQNMVLAAYSLGLQTSWIGIFDVKNQKNSAETKVKEILETPKNHRVITLLPIGHAKYDIPKKDRKELSLLVYEERFGKR
jgi:nitroreductase